MAKEVSDTTETKTTSDGTVYISVERYDELLRDASRPPTINRTVVQKTDEMLNKEKRVWGGSLMGLGTGLFAVGAGLFRSGR